jgi:PadR family transcriptional regulator, regulatory protein PadR
MDSSQLLKGVLDTAVLAVLENEDGYGYDIVRRLREAGFTDIGDATVYGTLRRLYAAGLLKTYVVPSDDGPHRKYYAVNKHGLEALQQQRGTWADFATNMSRILGTENKSSEGKSK